MVKCTAQTPRLPYQARNQAEIMAMLEKHEKVAFEAFEMVTEGNYAPYDAAWNYMDIPHLTYIHNQVRKQHAGGRRGTTSSIFFSESAVCPVPADRVISLSASLETSITYYTSFFLFLLIIETHWEEIAPLHLP